MILKALVDYYDRLSADPESEVAPFGFSRQKISFIIVLEKDGGLHAIQPDFVETGGRRIPRPRVVPGQSKPSGQGINPCFCWDNSAYMLGYKQDDTKPERTAECFRAFKDRHLALEKEINDPAFGAVCAFLRAWKPSEAAARPDLMELGTGFGVFQVRGETEFVHERERVLAYWRGTLINAPVEDEEQAMVGPSLLDGTSKLLARLHEPKIKGVVGGQSSGGVIIGFNEPAFESYGHSQSYNAPLGTDEAFKYCTALNALLSADRRRITIGEITIVCWTRQPEPFEDEFTQMLVEPPPDDPVVAERARNFFHRLRQGADASDLGNPSTPFYILALSPNAARISVRFFLPGTVGEFAGRLRDHLDALEILGARPERPLTVRRIVNTTLRHDDGKPDYDSLNERLAGDFVRAILSGTAYPQQVLSRVIRGVAADGTLNADRAAIIKACLIRNYRKEMSVALDIQRTDAPYRLGRLFAAFEKTQEDASEGKLNRTIKDGYFSSASASPATVFPRLCRLNHHHIERLDGGRKVKREKLIQEIIAPLGQFPRSLPLEDQGAFFIGYYHQRQDFFTARDKKEDGQ